MSTTRSHRSGGRTARRYLGRTTRLRLERLEDRLAPSLTAGSDVPGQLLIRFQPGVTTADIADFYAGHGLTELKNLDADRADHDEGVRLVATPTLQAVALIPTLQQDPRVRYAEPNGFLTFAQVPNDPSFRRDYGLLNTGQTGGTLDADIDADEAWDLTTGTSSIVVAVIDSGIDYTHPDLAANIWTNPGEIPGNKKDDDGNGFVDDVHGYDFMNDDGDPMDTFGHGTHVAGTIGMVGDNAVGGTGVSWNVKLMAVTMRDEFATIADAVAAINYVTMMRNRGVDVRVANASWGFWYLGSFPQTLADAVDALGQAGILFVAAANNQARDNDVFPHYPSGFDSPHIISVAATDQNDRYASFTNWGATSVDLAAPGVDVWSTMPGNSYGWSNGTSMAAPHVAGAAALVWSAFPNLSALEVKARLMNSVDPISHIGANASYPTVTNGRLNVRNALLVPVPDNDATPPAAVGNLAVSAASPWSVTLTWTATGDDGATGRAGFYDVRYSSAPITAVNWQAARQALAETAPRTAGSPESFTVTGLEPGTLYYFAVKVKDNAGNESALSNLAVGNTTAATYLLNDDMESGTGNWTATGLWHRSGVRGHDSATAWYFGKDSDRTYFTGGQPTGALTLAAPIDLSGVSRALLRFDEWRQVTDYSPLDAASVQVSRDGNNWTTVSESFLSSLDWERRMVDLTPFVGGPVYIRFDFNANAFGFFPWALPQGYEGWHVDNVQVLVPVAQPAGFSINDVTVTEGHDGVVQAVFTVTRSSGMGTASVQYATSDGSAMSAAGDYLPATGMLSFAPHETRKTVTVLVNGDRLGEADESFALNLSNPTGAVIADGQGKAVILDDEPRIHASFAYVFEDNRQSQPFAIAVNLSAPSSQTVTVRYATADGTARAGNDYLPTSGTLTFNAGETRKYIPLTVLKDNEQVPLQAFLVNFSNASSNAVILRRGVISVIDFDALNGNHFGYRNRTGGGFAAAGGGFFSVAGGNDRPDNAFDVNQPDVRIAAPAGATLGKAASNTIWLDANVARWGWFVGKTPQDNFKSLAPGNQEEQSRVDLLTVLTHELPGLLGHNHAKGVEMEGPFWAGTRRMPATDWSGDPALADLVFAGELSLSRQVLLC